MTALSEAALDGLIEALAPKLIARGFVVGQAPTPAAAPYSSDYDSATCEAFVRRHIGDGVLRRARIFFGLLDQHGEVNSAELVTALGLKNARHVSANLTNSLKQRARKLGIREPWELSETPDGLRTVWKDRGGLAGRMLQAIDDELVRRGVA